MHSASFLLHLVLFLLCLLTIRSKSDTVEVLEDEMFVPGPEYHMPLPDFIKPCSRKLKLINLCLKTSLQTFFDHIVNGSVEMNIPKVDPLYVRHLQVKEGSGMQTLELDFRDVVIHGLGQTKVISVRSNMDFPKLEITLKYPFLNIEGAYSGDGAIEDFPFIGEGPFSFNMTDVSAVWIIYLKKEEDKEFAAIKSFAMDIIPVEINARFGDDVDGDNELGSAVNKFFNENAHEMFKLSKPQMMKALSGIIINLANRVLSKFPAEVLLPP